MTGGADMRVTFKDYDHCKWMAKLFRTSKIFGSRFDKTIFFFERDIDNVNRVLEGFNDIFPIQYEIGPIRYISIEDAIEGTINKSDKPKQKIECMQSAKSRGLLTRILELF